MWSKNGANNKNLGNIHMCFIHNTSHVMVSMHDCAWFVNDLFEKPKLYRPPSRTNSPSKYQPWIEIYKVVFGSGI